MGLIRIIILEDHPVQRSILLNNLALLPNIEAFAFGSAKEAMTWLDSHHHADILICDIVMEGIDGLSFLRNAKENYEIKSIALYSCIEDELLWSVSTMIKLLGFNFLGDLKKKPSVDSLQGIIDRFLAHRAKSNIPQEAKKNVYDLPNFDIEDIKKALSMKQFVGFYQPKFDIKEFRLHGVEMLVRWQHPEFGVLQPGIFIDLFVKFNLLDKLMMQLVEQGSKLQKKLLNHGVELEIAYNLDVSQLNSPNFIHEIIDLISELGIPPKLITFEVTEAGILSVPSMNIENLVRMRIFGFSLSIDDIGASHSSLSRLCELPFSQIKLDGSFIKYLNSDNDSKYNVVIACIIELANKLKMELVIEGIETNYQLSKLSNMGAKIGQGFCFSQPVTQSQLIRRFFNFSMYKELHNEI